MEKERLEKKKPKEAKEKAEKEKAENLRVFRDGSCQRSSKNHKVICRSQENGFHQQKGQKVSVDSLSGADKKVLRALAKYITDEENGKTGKSIDVI
nr:ubiquitin-like-specific protease ESD4 isoform X1 [Tanacetum cinerariifolium]